MPSKLQAVLAFFGFSAVAAGRLQEAANLTLPWGSYAPKLDSSKSFYTFSDVRFGASPTGKLRFNPSKSPDGSDPEPDNSRITCMQISDLKGKCTGGNSPLVDPRPYKSASNPAEDCLFLDIYVPKAVYENAEENADTAVVVWLFGGAYVSGGKTAFDISDPFYTGQGMFQAAAEMSPEQNVIFVAGNYRLGAFGWLAGTTMEEDATPNVGLWDQRLMLEFVRDHIHLVGGDASQVSVWGESAGAGSILHHLVAWPSDPLFKRAILQSPAYQWLWDRKGTVEDTFQQFAKFLDCDEDQINCLQEKSTDEIQSANEDLFSSSRPCTGLFPVGPSVDNKLIPELPPLLLAKGPVADLDSIIVSHVGDESSPFVPPWIQDNVTAAEQYIDLFLSGDALKDVRQKVKDQYPEKDKRWKKQKDRVSAIIGDSTFYCNTRQVFNAYQGKAYMMLYQFGYGFSLYSRKPTHGMDLLATFWYSGWDVKNFISSIIKNLPIPIPEFIIGQYANWLGNFAPKYQRYFLSHALTGDPNIFSKGTQWEFAEDESGTLKQVLRAGGGGLIPPLFKSVSDKQNTNPICGFWYNISQDIQNAFSETEKAAKGGKGQLFEWDELK